MAAKLTAVDPAALRAASVVAPEDIPSEIKQNVREIVEHNEEAPRDLVHLQFETPEEKAEWKTLAQAYAAQNNIRLRESGIRGRAEDEGYFRAFRVGQ